MSGFELIARSCPVVAGALVGIIAFVPLSMAIRAALSRGAACGIGAGLLTVALSTAALIAGALVVRLMFEGLLLAFVCGELVGFFVCEAIAVVRVAARGDR